MATRCARDYALEDTGLTRNGFAVKRRIFHPQRTVTIEPYRLPRVELNHPTPEPQPVQLVLRTPSPEPRRVAADQQGAGTLPTLAARMCPFSHYLATQRAPPLTLSGSSSYSFWRRPSASTMARA